MVQYLGPKVSLFHYAKLFLCVLCKARDHLEPMVCEWLPQSFTHFMLRSHGMVCETSGPLCWLGPIITDLWWFCSRAGKLGRSQEVVLGRVTLSEHWEPQGLPIPSPISPLPLPLRSPLPLSCFEAHHREHISRADPKGMIFPPWQIYTKPPVPGTVSSFLAYPIGRRMVCSQTLE